MVKIWYMDEYSLGDPRLPQMAFPPQYVTPEKLKQRTGVFLWKIPMNDGMVTQMEWIQREHKFVMDNELVVKDGATPRYAEKLQDWYKPHTHSVEESRLVLEGQVYYDVEEPKTGKWLRIFLEKGDLIIIPVGCLHRFTPDTKNYVKFKRFYQNRDGEPTPISPETSDQLPTRLEYTKLYSQ